MTIEHKTDELWMRKALELAEQAAAEGEVPVGAVVVIDDEIVGSGFNQPISTCDPTAHAEIVALRQAAEKVGNYRLVDATLYVTLEPCSMCSGAVTHARVKRIVYAAQEPKAGVVESQQVFFEQEFLNHKPEVESGILAEESSALISDFFRKRREAKKSR